MPNTDRLYSALRGIVGEPAVVRDPERLGAYAVDGVAPRAVACPGTEEEVAGVVRYANAEGLAIVPRGNGTKMACGGVPPRVDIVLSTLRLDRILDCDHDNQSLSAEAGIALADVQRKLADGGRGNFLPLDPPRMEKATIGGVVATNASGPKRYRYGTVRDLLLGLRAVSAGGEILSFGGKTMKNVSGYDMTRLLAGSCGSLGIITAVTAKLLPLPEASATVVASFDSLSAAAPFLRKILHSVLLPSAIDLVGGKAAGRPGGEAKYLVALNFEGFAEAVDRQVSEAGAAAKQAGASSMKELREAADRDFWGGVRDFSLDAGNGSPSSVVLKSSFVLSKHAEILEAYEAAVRAAGVDAAFLLRAGNGILYTHLPGDAKGAGELAELVGRLTDEAARRGGNLVVESCPPEIKGKVDVWGRPRGDRAVMRRLKEKMDPRGVLNPGRFVGGM